VAWTAASIVLCIRHSEACWQIWRICWKWNNNV